MDDQKKIDIYIYIYMYIYDIYKHQMMILTRTIGLVPLYKMDPTLLGSFCRDGMLVVVIM